MICGIKTLDKFQKIGLGQTLQKLLPLLTFIVPKGQGRN